MSIKDKIKLLLWTVKLYLLSGFQNGLKKVVNSNDLLVIHYNHLPIYLRLMDLGIFYDIFHHEIYKIPKDWQVGKAITIVDLGAHIGLATIYFSIHNPTIKCIHCIEPNAQNFALLSKNTMAIDSVKLYPIAMSNMDEVGYLDTKGFGHNSKISDQGQTVTLKTWTSFCKEAQLTHINLMKIDIEGAEQFILSDVVSCYTPSHVLMEYHLMDTEEVKKLFTEKGSKLKIV